jgi:hypothetical protein
MSKKFIILASEDVSRRASGAENLEDLYRRAALDEQAEQAAQAALEWIEANVDDCLPDEPKQ